MRNLSLNPRSPPQSSSSKIIHGASLSHPWSLTLVHFSASKHLTACQSEPVSMRSRFQTQGEAQLRLDLARKSEGRTRSNTRICPNSHYPNSTTSNCDYSQEFTELEPCASQTSSGSSASLLLFDDEDCLVMATYLSWLSRTERTSVCLGLPKSHSYVP